MLDNNTVLIKILKEKEGKKIRLILKNGYSYITEDLKVFNDETILFHDKFSNEMMICVSEVTQVLEMSK